MGRSGYCSGRHVPALHNRGLFRWKGRFAGNGQRILLFRPYINHRLFFPEGRWGEDVLHSIFGMRPFMRSAHADHGASIPTANSGGLDASYLCRRFQLRSGVYASDCGQRHIDPTIASLILSLESVISVLAGWVILGQKLTVRELIGCILVFCAIILAQLPQKEEKIEEAPRRL